MPRITPAEVKKLFELARLPYDAGKVEAYQKDLDEILGYVAKLSHLDTAQAGEVHGGVDFLNAWRPDQSAAAELETRDRLVKLFPRSEADLNKVPPILDRS
jgi:aspartyl/glutamyl-tRNA(Asn/Gln) amidotransferase C subunit